MTSMTNNLGRELQRGPADSLARLKAAAEAVVAAGQ